jgi:tryptophan 2,3-dioxygenase
MRTSSPLYYADYLRLDRLLSSQDLRSVEHGTPAHDELLFITVHQVYELWFKQILHEMDAFRATFGKDYVDEKEVGIAVSRLTRIIEIQKLLVDQLNVLETMTALDFLDFRDLLYPASGFQSYQFRLIENRMGMDPGQRILYNRESYYAHLKPAHQELLRNSEMEPSMLRLVERWLERTPFLDFEGFDFWRAYEQAVRDMFEGDRQTILGNPVSTEEEKKQQLREVDVNQENFSVLLDPSKHNDLVGRGHRRLSHRATKAALLILLYRDEPILHIPFRLLTALMDIDELFTTWRSRHALMVQRMIGNKIGTGGSTGYGYLKATVDRYKVFGDVVNLSTFLIPRSLLPALPENLKRNLGFHYLKGPAAR